MRIAVLSVLAASFLSLVSAIVVAPQVSQASEYFLTPTLTEVRDILARIQPAIISTLVQRMSLPVKPSLYQGSSCALHNYMFTREMTASSLGRYAYGTLESAFTFNTITPDKTTANNTYPPGRYHSSDFSPAANLTAWYTDTLIPLLDTTIGGYFAHLSNATTNLFPDRFDDDAVLALDVQLLQVMANRASVSAAVAEAKFASDVPGFTSFIRANNVTAIHTALQNVTQEGVVLASADAAANALATAYIAAGAILPADFVTAVRTAAHALYRNLIDLTTLGEVTYILQRLH
ncbi:chorismate mutase [Hysterangium stoloniferum]|nr:chorismate mutase [Hysterangium stoloniferum]